MKKNLILLINVYKIVFSSVIHQLVGMQYACRFSPTCSQFAIISIKKHGAIKGSYYSLLRLLKCQPFYSPPSSLGKEKAYSNI